MVQQFQPESYPTQKHLLFQNNLEKVGCNVLLEYFQNSLWELKEQNHSIYSTLGSGNGILLTNQYRLRAGGIRIIQENSIPETDGNIGIVSKVPIPMQLVSVSVSIQWFLESRYQYRYRSRGLSIFCKVLAEFLLSKVSVSVSVPVHFHGISISIGLDVDQVWVSVSVSVSVQGHKKYQYQYRLEIPGPVCLWYGDKNEGLANHTMSILSLFERSEISWNTPLYPLITPKVQAWDEHCF